MLVSETEVNAGVEDVAQQQNALAWSNVEADAPLEHLNEVGSYERRLPVEVSVHVYALHVEQLEHELHAD